MRSIMLSKPKERDVINRLRHDSLNAYHESGSIVIEVHDDGKGLDSERIRQSDQQRAH